MNSHCLYVTTLVTICNQYINHHTNFLIDQNLNKTNYIYAFNFINYVQVLSKRLNLTTNGFSYRNHVRYITITSHPANTTPQLSNYFICPIFYFTLTGNILHLQKNSHPPLHDTLHDGYNEHRKTPIHKTKLFSELFKN